MLEYKRRQEEELTKRMLEERNREKAEEKAARERIRQQIAMVNFALWKRACCFSLSQCSKMINFLIWRSFERLFIFPFRILWPCIVTIVVFGVYVAFPVYKMKLLLSSSQFFSIWTNISVILLEPSWELSYRHKNDCNLGMVLKEKHREYLIVEHTQEPCSQNGEEDYFLSLCICVPIYGCKQLITIEILPHY